MRNLLVLAAAAVLVAACAKRGRPGGGPEDTIAPFVHRWSPPAGADSVPPDQPLTLTWSEPVERPTVEDRLVVSPDTVAIEGSWKGRTLTLVPRGGWVPRTTHWVWISPGVKDTHGLPMEEPFFTWFTTADSAPGTVLMGEVSMEGRPVPQATVVCSNETTPLTWRCGTDARGSFSAPSLTPHRRWQVFAFLDQDRDGRYRRGVEPRAVTFVDLEADSTRLPPLSLALEDTVPPLVREARPEHARCLRIGFSEPVVVTEGRFAVEDTAGGTFPVTIVSSSSAEPAVVRLVLERPLRDDLVRIGIGGIADSSGLPLADTSLVCMGTSLQDTVPPALTRLLVDPGRRRVWMLFSEPMAPQGADALGVWEVPGFRQVEGRATWRDLQVLSWTASIPPRLQSRVVIVLAGASDLAGLTLPLFVSLVPDRADSLVPPWEVMVLPP